MVRRFIPLMIAVVILAAYANSLRGPFIFDDLQTISTNPQVRALWPLTEAMSAPPQSATSGRPLVCLSLALNYAVGGYEPIGYHLFNLATHIAAALLLFGLIRRTWVDERSRSFAAAAALIWAVHPILTESVDYITQRTETMESMFLLLMLYAMSRRWHVAAVIACGAGMMCKEQMAVAPLLAILYDWTFPRGRRSRLFYLALFACWIILPIELSGVDLDSKSGYGLKYVRPFDYLKTQALVICHYLRLCFWPSGLVIDYTDWPIVHGIGPAVLPGALIVALLGASVYLVILRRWEGFAGVWFFLILAPTSSVLPNFTEIAAERRMYLASVPVVVLTLAALPWKKVLTPVLVLLLMIVTIARNEDYRSSIAIWSDAVAKRPENWHSHYFLARAYVDASNWEAARREDEIAIDLQPNAVAPRSLEERIRNRE